MPEIHARGAITHRSLKGRVKLTAKGSRQMAQEMSRKQKQQTEGRDMTTSVFRYCQKQKRTRLAEAKF